MGILDTPPLAVWRQMAIRRGRNRKDRRTDDDTDDDSSPLHQLGRRECAPPETVFILLGGAARGAAQAGALRVLLERGIVPDAIIGISAGAWNGGYLAVDPTPERAAELERLWQATTSKQVVDPHWRLPLNLLGNQHSLYRGNGVRQMADRYLAGRTFEQLRIPLTVVAADLLSGEPVFFTSGDLDHAVLASSAIPGIFPPVVDGERLLVDGACAEWAGCLAALRLGARRLILVGCGIASAGHTSRPGRARWPTFSHLWGRSMDMGIRQDFERTLFALQGATREVLGIFPKLPFGPLLDFDHAPLLIAAGRLAAEQAIERWEHTRDLLQPRWQQESGIVQLKSA